MNLNMAAWRYHDTDMGLNTTTKPAYHERSPIVRENQGVLRQIGLRSGQNRPMFTALRRSLKPDTYRVHRGKAGTSGNRREPWPTARLSLAHCALSGKATRGQEAIRYDTTDSETLVADFSVAQIDA